jgi:hypothetical protein
MEMNQLKKKKKKGPCIRLELSKVMKEYKKAYTREGVIRRL